MTKKTDYEIVDSCEGIDFSEVADLLKFYGLSELDADMQKKAFENSYVTIFLKKDHRIIGVGRAISDGVCQAAISNIAIKDEYRGNGLGKVVVDEILKRVEGFNVTLYTSPKHIGLYEHWGFSRLKTAYVIFPDPSHYREAGFIE